MKTVHFDLKDADGESHRYEVELFSCDENVRLQLMIAGPLFKVIGRALAALVPAFAESGSEALKDLESVTSSLARIDWAAAPEALNAIPEMIEARGGPELVARIFSQTYRLLPVPELQRIPTASGDGAIDSNVRQHLALASERDAAFGDGNFAEYWSAVAMVLIVNFTRYGRSGSKDWRKLVETLTGGILTPSAPKIGTMTASNVGRVGNAPPAS